MLPHPLRLAHKVSGAGLQPGRPELGKTEADVEISKKTWLTFEGSRLLLVLDNANFLLCDLHRCVLCLGHSSSSAFSQKPPEACGLVQSTKTPVSI